MRRQELLIRRAKARRGLAQGGFTLIEIIVASLVFAIGSMAVLTMMFSSLQAYAASRDQTIASDIAARVAAVIKMEAKIGPAMLASGALSPYTGAAFGGNTPIIRPLNAAGDMWTGWTALTPQPVDERMTTRGAARYCVYVRGGQLPTAVTADNGVGGPVAVGSGVTVQAQIAVVYPAANNAFTNPLSCALSVGNVADLNPQPLAAGDAALALELRGLRVVYTGVLATVRQF